MLENQEKEEEEKLAIAKDCEVEVRSEEEGFVGAWYRAILEDSPTKSRRIKLRVRYTTLLKNDCSAPLTEAVQQSFIRPVPPEDLYDGVVFVEGSVVDADLKDGWWEGVVAKKLEDEQYLVCFDTPPDILQFNRKQLRPHLDWTGSQWVRPENKELSKSLFSSGTMVEVSRDIRLEAAWVPAIVVTEVEAGVVVKSCYKSLTFNAEEVTPSFAVDVRKVRPVPPPSSVEEYILSAPVDAFNGSAWRRCVVTAIRTDKSYQVSFVGTKEKDVFKHSDLRPSMEWEDGVWLPKKKLEKDTPPSDGQKKRYLSEINALSRPKKLKVIRSCGATKPGGSATVTPKHVRQSPVLGEATEGETELHETVAVKKSGNQIAGGGCGVMNGAAATPVPTIPIEKESAPPVTSVIKAAPFITLDAETQVMTTPKKTLQPMSVQTEEKTSEEHDNKGISQDSNLDDTVMYPTELSTPEDETTGASEDTTMVLPFVKRSPVWKAIESMQVYKKAKQNPHFTPLLGTREELREGLAAGVMVNFSSLLERVTNLHLHTPKSILEGLKECFYESEKYGFDVAEPISRIAMLVSLVEENFSREDKLKEMEKGKAEAVSKVEKLREELRDVECKILELQNQKRDLKGKEDAEEKRIAYLQMCAEEIDKRSQEAELKFQEIVSASW